MVRRFLCLGVGALALLVALGAPGQLYAQHFRGGSHLGFSSGFQRGSTPGFGFVPRFRGGAFDRRFSRGRFDRFEDRFENRFGFRRFDRFEDRFENRFGFTPGFGFNPFFNGVFFDPGF